ncbi:hypothetical protein COLO4_30707 [Corchorus olitorius]|uniref:Uncharacterized protein n=1 Tax=Corchorus olitorius TaxID=93759 RepID=A0A1R3H7B9_9ROSI|nr:hypothetical protein COLO4_30707 [Corchorus olitorius]
MAAHFLSRLMLAVSGTLWPSPQPSPCYCSPPGRILLYNG